MGYYINIVDCDFRIPQEKLGDAYQAMCELNKRDDLKRGGTLGADGTRKRWFAWMHPNYPETCSNAIEILEALGFHISTNEEGDVTRLEYDSKIGQEELFLEAIAPFVEHGSYIDWVGEDNERWRYLFEDGVMETWEAVISYRKTEKEA